MVCLNCLGKLLATTKTEKKISENVLSSCIDDKSRINGTYFVSHTKTLNTRFIVFDRSMTEH